MTLTETMMKAYTYIETGRFELIDKPKPELQDPKDAIVRVRLSSTCSTAFTLHFSYLHNLTEEVLLTLSRPLVHVLCHGRRWGDRVDGCMLAEKVCDMRRCPVTVTSDEFFLVCHML